MYPTNICAGFTQTNVSHKCIQQITLTQKESPKTIYQTSSYYYIEIILVAHLFSFHIVAHFC